MEMEKLAKLLLGVLVLLVILVGGFILVRHLIAGLPFGQEKLLQETESMRTLLLRNFEMCDKVDDDGCLCELFPNFPAVLPKSFSLNFRREGSKTNVTLNLGSNVVDWRVIDSYVFDIFYYQFISMINFDSFPSYVTTAGNKKSIRSKYAFKSYTLTGTPKIQFLRVLSCEFNENEVKEMEEKGKCKEGRAKALDFFYNLKNKISKISDKKEQEVKVDIPTGFYIKVNKDNMTLMSGNSIEYRVGVYLELGKCKLKFLPVSYSAAGLTCDGKEFELRNGDIVVIKKQGEQGGKVCIEKKAST
jgi:hypothetical protein